MKHLTSLLILIFLFCISTSCQDCNKSKSYTIAYGSKNNKEVVLTHYNHACMFAAYYLKNNNPTKTIELMTYYIDNFPDEARPYTVLCNTYKQLNDKKKAKAFYQKAFDLGTKNADPILSEYKTNLQELNR